MDMSEYKEAIGAALEDAHDDIVNHAVSKMKENLANKMSWAAEDQVQKQVKQWVDIEIAPAIQDALDANKDVFLHQLKDAVVKIGAGVAEGLVQQAIENTTKGWNMKKIATALFD
jgi:hypothetical protein